MKPDQDLLDEWNLLVHQAKDCVGEGTEDWADRVIIAMDDYIYWLETEIREKNTP